MLAAGLQRSFLLATLVGLALTVLVADAHAASAEPGWSRAGATLQLQNSRPQPAGLAGLVTACGDPEADPDDELPFGAVAQAEQHLNCSASGIGGRYGRRAFGVAEGPGATGPPRV